MVELKELGKEIALCIIVVFSLFLIRHILKKSLGIKIKRFESIIDYLFIITEVAICMVISKIVLSALGQYNISNVFICLILISLFIGITNV